MKYGLILYGDTDNVGDDILTYSAIRFLPSIDYIIDRESLDTFFPDKKEYVSVIMNGWFLFNKYNWTPSPYINPKIIGIHFSDNSFSGIIDEYLDDLGKEYLSNYSPIGCRDHSTLLKLQKREINSYFSGCLTLTLNKFEDIVKNDKYILVDVPEIIQNKVIKEIGKEKVELISHNISLEDRGKKWEQRKKVVEKLLRKYQSAEVIITTRLHCALPALALGTKVCLIGDETEDFCARKGSYLKYLNYYSINDFLKLDLKNVIIENNSSYVELRKQLIGECERFIKDCQKYTLDKNILPEVSIFEKLYAKKINWQMQLAKSENMLISKKIYNELVVSKEWLDKQYINLTNEIEELDKYNNELLKTEKWYQEQCKSKDVRIEELEKYVNELLKNQEWYQEQCKSKDARIEELEKWCKELGEGKDWLEKQLENLET